MEELKVNAAGKAVIPLHITHRQRLIKSKEDALYPRHEITELIPKSRFNSINSVSSGRQKTLHLGASPEPFHSRSYFARSGSSAGTIAFILR